VAHFVATFNTRTSPVSGRGTGDGGSRATECTSVTMLVPATEYVQSAWFKERYMVVDPSQDVFDKVGSCARRVGTCGDSLQLFSPLSLRVVHRAMDVAST
jgi:hypothetical protein